MYNIIASSVTLKDKNDIYNKQFYKYIFLSNKPTNPMKLYYLWNYSIYFTEKHQLNWFQCYFTKYYLYICSDEKLILNCPVSI